MRPVEDIRDLSDLCEHWTDLRAILLDREAPNQTLTGDQEALVGWLVLLADRVCLDFDRQI